MRKESQEFNVVPSGKSLRFADIILVLLGMCLSATIVYANSNQEQLNKEAFTAVKEGDRQKIQELVSQGLNPNYKLGEPRNLMRVSAAYGRAGILEVLIRAGGNVDHKLKDNMYFSTYVALKNDLQLLKPVLAQKPDLNKLMYVDQYTAFTGMLRYINEETLRYVIGNSNADVNFRPKNGLSPLFHAYARGKCGLKCVDVLLEHGANPCLAIDPSGKSFFIYLKDNEQSDKLKNIDSYNCTKSI